jgi:hypothetical protein
VRENDIGETGNLELRLLRMKEHRIGTPSGNWRLMEFKKSDLQMEDFVKDFPLGDHVVLDSHDLIDCISTLFFFEHQMVDPLTSHYQRCGVEVTRVDGRPQMAQDRLE